MNFSQIYREEPHAAPENARRARPCRGALAAARNLLGPGVTGARREAYAWSLVPSFLIALTSLRTVCANVFSSCIALRTRVPAALLPSL